MSCDFEELCVDDRLIVPLLAAGRRQANEVQVHLIRAVGSGTDVVSETPPGYFRTTALCIATLQKLIIDPSHRILFLVPTKEVGLHCLATFASYAKTLDDLDVTCHAVVEGNSPQDDLVQLRDGRPTAVVGQPSCLRMVKENDGTSMDDFTIVVLLQAEHLLDKRYKEQFDRDVLFLLLSLPFPCAGRQTVVSSSRPLPRSATMPVTNMPIEIRIGRPEPWMASVVLRLRLRGDMLLRRLAGWPPRTPWPQAALAAAVVAAAAATWARRRCS